jgi:predicted metal-binding membrane protein
MAATGPAFVASWALVMAAMMLPSELPLLRLDHATSRSALRSVVLGLGYLAVWTALAVPVWVADRAAGGRLLGMHGPTLTAIVLAAAAAYQLTPLKHRCLAVCRAPLARILHGWRDGLGGAFHMGVVNGLWCAGCCAGLTAALFVLGMTNVAWMLVVGATIFVEKATRVGVAAGRVAAVVLAVGAVVWAI